jgi:hypothetical protein
VADLIQPLDMTLRDRFLFCAAPVSVKEAAQMAVLFRVRPHGPARCGAEV